MKKKVILFIIAVVIETCTGTDSSPSFKIDTNNKQFLLDGDPFRYISGEIHYFRMPAKKWDDRLKRVRAMGLNAITIPIPWNLHQFEEDNSPIFSNNLDVFNFIETANTNGLYSIVKIGPYIDAEWDNGGIPWWLIRKTELKKYRSNDPIFMEEVKKWWSHLLPKLFNLMRRNGGPILMVQIEHMYGKLGICDQDYMNALVKLAKEHLGDDAVLYTVDPPVSSMIKCGHVDNVLTTIAPTSNSSQMKDWFNIQQLYSPNSPPVAGQFLIGAYKMWGMNVTDKYSENDVVQAIEAAYILNASINLYLAHGGTNFGYWNGAIGRYPITTSHDSFAPISEAGDITSLFVSIRNFITYLPDWKYPPIDIPSIPAREAYSPVNLGIFDSITDYIIGALPECWKSMETPFSAEDIRHGYGYLYYNTTFLDCGTLSIPNFADDAYIYVNKNFEGVLYKQYSEIHNNTMILQGCLDDINTLEIVIEISGRISNTYPDISKGLQGNVYINNASLQGWYSCQVPIETYLIKAQLDKNNLVNNIQKISNLDAALQPSVFIGDLKVHSTPMDTFLDMRGWGKGVVTINEYNIGRYWSTNGPQQTLYIPSDFLKKGSNLIMIYEFEGSTTACTTTSCQAKFTRLPIFDY